MLVVRFAKIVLVAAIAAFAFVVAYDNVVDYDSNYEFVRHVLSMDTTFLHNALMHRVITDPQLWTAAYVVIIALEAVTSLLLIVGALALLALINAPPAAFNLQGLGGGRSDCRLHPVVLRLSGRCRRIFCHVAIEDVEWAGSGLSDHSRAARRPDLRLSSRTRRALTGLRHRPGQ